MPWVERNCPRRFSRSISQAARASFTSAIWERREASSAPVVARTVSSSSRAADAFCSSCLRVYRCRRPPGPDRAARIHSLALCASADAGCKSSARCAEPAVEGGVAARGLSPTSAVHPAPPPLRAPSPMRTRTRSVMARAICSSASPNEAPKRPVKSNTPANSARGCEGVAATAAAATGGGIWLELPTEGAVAACAVGGGGTSPATLLAGNASCGAGAGAGALSGGAASKGASVVCVGAGAGTAAGVSVETEVAVADSSVESGTAPPVDARVVSRVSLGGWGAADEEGAAEATGRHRTGERPRSSASCVRLKARCSEASASTAGTPDRATQPSSPSDTGKLVGRGSATPPPEHASVSNGGEPFSMVRKCAHCTPGISDGAIFTASSRARAGSICTAKETKRAKALVWSTESTGGGFVRPPAMGCIQRVAGSPPWRGCARRRTTPSATGSNTILRFPRPASTRRACWLKPQENLCHLSCALLRARQFYCPLRLGACVRVC